MIRFILAIGFLCFICSGIFAQGSSGGSGPMPTAIESQTWVTSHTVAVATGGSSGGSTWSAVPVRRRLPTVGEMRRSLRSIRAETMRSALFFAFTN
jgi:hypothetical protein